MHFLPRRYFWLQTLICSRCRNSRNHSSIQWRKNEEKNKYQCQSCCSETSKVPDPDLSVQLASHLHPGVWSGLRSAIYWGHRRPYWGLGRGDTHSSRHRGHPWTWHCRGGGGAGDGGARRMGLAKWQWVMWCKGGACRGLLLQGLDLTAGLGGASVPMAAPHAPARQPPNNLLLFILLLPPEIIAIINFPDISPVCLFCRWNDDQYDHFPASIIITFQKLGILVFG